MNGVKKILDSSEIPTLDDNMNLGLYRLDLQNTKNIKDKIKKIHKIIKELKDLSNG